MRYADPPFPVFWMHSYIVLHSYICAVAFLCLTAFVYLIPFLFLSHSDMGWLRLVGSLKSWVFSAEYSLFHRALLHKRPIILRSLLIAATPYLIAYLCLTAFLYSIPFLPYLYLIAFLYRVARTHRMPKLTYILLHSYTGWQGPIGCLSWLISYCILIQGGKDP